jgi:dihydroorotate dehydrogenase
MWYPLARTALFRLDPERAHQLALEGLRALGRLGSVAPPGSPATLMGLRFPNRVGLAAGFDKNAIAIDGLGALGFGFIEVGTVTPRPQPGQQRPRVFRIPRAGALVNRLGFPNDGAAVIVARLAKRRYRGILGVNLGKNADTPLSQAAEDYLAGYRAVRSVADYVTVNISSPNTAGLRDLQSPHQLGPLLSKLIAERDTHQDRYLPILVKVSPDLSQTELSEIAALLLALRIDGVVATNTTLARSGVSGHIAAESGGLSGRPLRERALSTVAMLRKLLGADFPIVGVGGIDSPESALAMRHAGADLIQIYTGLVYRGPRLVRRCAQALRD